MQEARGSLPVSTESLGRVSKASTSRAQQGQDTLTPRLQGSEDEVSALIPIQKRSKMAVRMSNPEARKRFKAAVGLVVNTNTFTKTAGFLDRRGSIMHDGDPLILPLDFLPKDVRWMDPSVLPLFGHLLSCLLRIFVTHQILRTAPTLALRRSPQPCISFLVPREFFRSQFARVSTWHTIHRPLSPLLAFLQRETIDNENTRVIEHP
jgi:hypothetical protein